MLLSLYKGIKMITRDRYTEYDTWAWLYNQTMGPQYCTNQLPALELMLLSQLPQGAKLLDLCCGTGHLMQPLIERRYNVIGLDGSEAMLDYARQNAPQAKIILGDARTFKLSSLDGVYSTSASLNHVLDLEELKAVFHNVYQALNQNGSFMFDLNHAEQMEKWWNNQLAEGEIESEFAWYITPNYNKNTRLGNFKITLFQNKDHTITTNWKRFYKILNSPLLTKLRLRVIANFQRWKKWHTSEITYQVRGYLLSEVQTALAEVGFTNIEIKTIAGKSDVDNNHSAYFVCRKS